MAQRRERERERERLKERPQFIAHAWLMPIATARGVAEGVGHTSSGREAAAS